MIQLLIEKALGLSGIELALKIIGLGTQDEPTS
jgi:hypothetical protein